MNYASPDLKLFFDYVPAYRAEGACDRLAQKPGASSEQVNCKISVYRFFPLVRILNPFAVVIPLPEADEVWHVHMLSDTLQFQNDCKMLYCHELFHCDRTALPNPEAAIPIFEKGFLAEDNSSHFRN